VSGRSEARDPEQAITFDEKRPVPHQETGHLQGWPGVDDALLTAAAMADVHCGPMPPGHDEHGRSTVRIAADALSAVAAATTRPGT
jgi:hypothetical protein